MSDPDAPDEWIYEDGQESICCSVCGIPTGPDVEPCPDHQPRAYARWQAALPYAWPRPYEASRPDALDTWDDTLPPGGMTCAICGLPTESEPCQQHQPAAWARTYSKEA